MHLHVDIFTIKSLHYTQTYFKNTLPLCPITTHCLQMSFFTAAAKVDLPERVDATLLQEFELMFPRDTKPLEFNGEEEQVTMMPFDGAPEEEGRGRRSRSHNPYEEEPMETDDQPPGCRQS